MSNQYYNDPKESFLETDKKNLIVLNAPFLNENFENKSSYISFVKINRVTLSLKDPITPTSFTTFRQFNDVLDIILY